MREIVIAALVLVPAALANAQPVAAPIHDQPINYQCPETYPGDDGRALTLVERRTGTWKVNEPVPFVLGSGRFWRLVCAYRDPGSPTGEMEAAVHWVELPHEDGRLIVDGICGGASRPGDVASADRQATARAGRDRNADPGAANLRLAREMLDAAAAAAIPCPGTLGAPRICRRWKVVEMYQPGRHRECEWTQGSSTSDPSVEFRYVYRSECRVGGFVSQGAVTRTGPGRFERSVRRSEDRRTVYVYRGDFERGGDVEGTFQWISPDGDRGVEMLFEAHCLEE